MSATDDPEPFPCHEHRRFVVRPAPSVGNPPACVRHGTMRLLMVGQDGLMWRCDGCGDVEEQLEGVVIRD